MIQQYRLNCLFNVSFKIFTNVCRNRINLVPQKVIRSSQTNFLPSRYILEGVVVLPETIHELHRKTKDEVILKLDFEKVYDKVKWPFLWHVLHMKGFSSRWASWRQQVTLKWSIWIKVNDNVRTWLSNENGVSQGDPLSHILFNIVVDVIAILIAQAKDSDLSQT
jgi:hypothetical protein